MGDFSPWTQMGNAQPSDQSPASPAPSTSGTARDYGNMLNQYYGGAKKKKKKLMNESR